MSRLLLLRTTILKVINGGALITPARWSGYRNMSELWQLHVEYGYNISAFFGSIVWTYGYNISAFLVLFCERNYKCFVYLAMDINSRDGIVLIPHPCLWAILHMKDMCIIQTTKAVFGTMDHMRCHGQEIQIELFSVHFPCIRTPG